jgi:hypothetical protein
MYKRERKKGVASKFVLLEEQQSSLLVQGEAECAPTKTGFGCIQKKLGPR